MAEKAVHTFPVQGNWATRLEGSDDVLGVFDTKTEAVKDGREKANAFHADHVIHDNDGSVSQRISYKDGRE